MALFSLLFLACSDGGGEEAVPKNEVVSWTDTDGDTILDLHEGYVDPDSASSEEDTAGTGEAAVSVDSDADGTPDYQDLDADDDTLPDADEAGDDDVLTLPWDSDADGTPDYLDRDSDDNCVSDKLEGDGDLDEDDVRDAADLDDDGDGILDTWEMDPERCRPVDSDGDGTEDYQDLDSDEDGVGDMWEAGTSAWETEPADTDGDGTYDYLDTDSDADGLSDTVEGGTEKPKQEPLDTDGDGYYDNADTDSDGDGLSDADEVASGTNHLEADSDGDGFLDGAERTAGTNPNDPTSVIEGIYVTVAERTSVDESFSFELSIQMGDVAFLLDTTCSMSGTISGMTSQYSSIVSSLSSTLPDAEYGVATFDDYAANGMGSSGSGDKPFELRQQVTSDVARVQSIIGAIGLHGGGDAPESSMEALYQGLTGAGYDQNCNRVYDSSTDVRPFIASSAVDVFNGNGGEYYNASTTGGGTLGGFGFRDYALPVLVYATDAQMRDDDSGGYQTPGGCNDAGQSDVVREAANLGAYLIGIAVNSSAPVNQMNALADATNSFADTDGDGRADERLVFSWTNGNASSLRDTIVNAIDDLVGSITINTVTLEVVGDTYGFVSGITPASYNVAGAPQGQQLDFQLNFRGAVAAAEADQVFLVTLNVVGDGTLLLDTLDIYILVPGSSY